MDLQQCTDAMLVAWMIEGREGCVGELMARYHQAVGSLLRRLTGDSRPPDIGGAEFVRFGPVRAPARPRSGGASGSRGTVSWPG